MTRIGVMSDTHGVVPKQIYTFFKDVDVILHAGDIGSSEVLKTLRAYKKTIAVYGNCDDRYMDDDVKRIACFNIEDVRILMTHIGGYPGRYDSYIKPYFLQEKPDIFICGHSHILKIVYDQAYRFLCVNPGACGTQGFHQTRTLLRFEIDGKEIKNMELMDFDKWEKQ